LTQLNEGAPELVAIDPDDWHAEHVGLTADSRQFFLTTPFEPGFAGRAGGEFIALYLFDAAGQLIESRSDELGPRATVDEGAAREAYERRPRELGEVTLARIVVAPSRSSASARRSASCFVCRRTRATGGPSRLNRKLHGVLRALGQRRVRHAGRRRAPRDHHRRLSDRADVAVDGRLFLTVDEWGSRPPARARWRARPDGSMLAVIAVLLLDQATVVVARVLSHHSTLDASRSRPASSARRSARRA
jgi:hypothetical protein